MTDKPMTVGDLIIELSGQPADKPLSVYTGNGQPCYMPIKVSFEGDKSLDGVEFLNVSFKR